MTDRWGRKMHKEALFSLSFSLLLFSHLVMLTFYNPMDCSTPGFPILYHLPELVQTHVH